MYKRPLRRSIMQSAKKVSLSNKSRVLGGLTIFMVTKAPFCRTCQAFS